MQAFHLGPVGLVALPVEPFAEIGAAVKERSPFPATLFSGDSNGYYGYMPTRDAYSAGGYGVATAPYVPKAADMAIDTAVEALMSLA